MIYISSCVCIVTASSGICIGLGELAGGNMPIAHIRATVTDCLTRELRAHHCVSMTCPKNANKLCFNILLFT